ncbi:MAG: hypothetical protein Q9M91_06375 [Candidatus Dojkabacteria bacterium]|nr:hypothetical protein [Candidatus Dojkabacteria bacterium]MDQ7021421.1 hypothetical protein [Candidatus Dojkabacteria bacterium]
MKKIKLKIKFIIEHLDTRRRIILARTVLLIGAFIVSYLFSALLSQLLISKDNSDNENEYFSFLPSDAMPLELDFLENLREDQLFSCDLDTEGGSEVCEAMVINLSQAFLDDASFTRINDCAIKYSNPNIENFSFAYYECIWDISQSSGEEGNFSTKMNYYLLFKNRINNTELKMLLFIPGNIGWSAISSCRNDDDLIDLENKMYRFKNNSGYFLRVYFPNDDDFATVYNSAKDLIPSSYNETRIEYVKYCLQSVPNETHLTLLSKNKKNVKYEGDYPLSLPVIFSIKASDTDSLRDADTLVSTLTF